MLREIITPQTQDYMVKIPAEYLNTKVEILVLPFSEDKISSVETTDLIKKTAGIINKSIPSNGNTKCDKNGMTEYEIFGRF